MWQEVCNTIEAGYSKYGINLLGYTAQFKTDDKGAVFSALTSDWENACKAKLERNERQMLNRAKCSLNIYVVRQEQEIMRTKRK